MAPSRTTRTSSSTSVAGPSEERSNNKTKRNPYANKPRQQIRQDSLPGVQKLKSALRQTKRLLSKDNLAADVRVATERRLKALEADLARAEQSRKEGQQSAKYHKVKFFERKKVLRRINQAKRSIASSEGEDKKELESTLTDLRVDLNYVLHFPRAQKYVSLFPPEVRKPGSTAIAVAASSDDNEERSKVRQIMRQRMERGELSNEPENELGKLGQNNDRSISRQGGTNVPPPSTLARTHTDDVEEDDFFGDDDDDDDEDFE